MPLTQSRNILIAFVFSWQEASSTQTASSGEPQHCVIDSWEHTYLINTILIISRLISLYMTYPYNLHFLLPSIISVQHSSFSNPLYRVALGYCNQPSLIGQIDGTQGWFKFWKIFVNSFKKKIIYVHSNIRLIVNSRYSKGFIFKCKSQNSQPRRSFFLGIFT